MDIEMNEFNSMLSSLLHCDVSFIDWISSEKFCSCLIKQLQTKLENDSFTTQEDNSHLIILSALINLLEMTQINRLPSHLIGTKQQYYFTASEFGKPEPTENANDWFEETSKILSSHGKCISHILINISRSKRNKFVVFLSRKALISGLKTGFWRVKQILQHLDAHILESNIHHLWITELLKDLVVHALQRKSEAEIILPWCEGHCVVQKIVLMFERTSSSSKVLELLLLLQKLVKVVTADLESDKKDRNLAYLKTLFCEVLFPNVQLVLRASDMKQQNIFQFLKVLDNFLVTEWLHPDQPTPTGVIDILKDFHSQSAELLNSLQCVHLQSYTNFIGKEKKQSNSELYASSNLLRYITLVFLKSCALSSQTSQSSWKSLQPFLQVLDWTMEKPKDDNSVQKWFMAHFADQDNHWITSLFSLLIIYKHLKERHSDLQEDDTALNLRSGVSTPQEFLLIFCPHKAFLYFVEFIDYDHLVLSDFLISPETSFLPYILNYLRFVLDEWGYFQKIVTSPTQNINSEQTGFIPNEKCINFDKSECEILYDNDLSKHSEMSSLQHPNPSVQQMVQIVAYSDSDSDDSASSPPLSKKCCLEHHIKTEQNDIKASGTVRENITHFAENSQSIIIQTKTNALEPVEDRFDRVMGMFIRLRMHIGRLENKGLFPYKAKSLVKLLIACEDNYEK